MTVERLGDLMPKVLEKYQLKPLETKHSGCVFRSRIEARWAVFFESLGLAYEYEREGYDLGGGVLYLPDFWLPQLKFWFEVKGDDPDELACDKAWRLATASGFRTYVFFSGITMPDSAQGPPRGYVFFPDETADSDFSWCECPDCGQLGIEYQGRSDRLPCKEGYLCAWYRQPSQQHFDSYDIHTSECDCAGCNRHGSNLDRGENCGSARLVQAYKAARSARFGR